MCIRDSPLTIPTDDGLHGLWDSATGYFDANGEARVRVPNEECEIRFEAGKSLRNGPTKRIDVTPDNPETIFVSESQVFQFGRPARVMDPAWETLRNWTWKR